MKTTVGELRHQAAYSDSKDPVLVIVADEELKELLGKRTIMVSSFSPDNTDASGKSCNSLKIKIMLAK